MTSNFNEMSQHTTSFVFECRSFPPVTRTLLMTYSLVHLPFWAKFCKLGESFISNSILSYNNTFSFQEIYAKYTLENSFRISIYY